MRRAKLNDLPFGGKLAVDMKDAERLREALTSAMDALDLDREQGLSAAVGAFAMLLDIAGVDDEEIEGVLQAVATLRDALADGLGDGGAEEPALN